MVRGNFIAVAINGRMTMGSDNLEGRFIREDCQLRLAGAGGNLVAVTAEGEVLEKSWNVLRAYESWLMLPEHKRRPDGIEVPLLPHDDTPLTGPGGRLIRQPQPPVNGLILKVHLRALSRNTDGLRHMQRDEIPSERNMANKRNYYDANPDYLWLKKDEFQTMIPQDAHTGMTFPVSDVVAERIIRFHLNPTLVFGETNGWEKRDIRDWRLELSVESVTTDAIQIRMEGFAHVGSDFATADAMAKKQRSSPGYEPQLLGFLEFDRRQQKFTRFDLVALGDTYGQLGGDLKYLYRSGRNPLGITFELVSPEGSIADRTVPPRGMRFPKNYYSTGK